MKSLKKMRKPKLGENLFLVYYPTIGVNDEYYKPEVIVVGRKYFTVEFANRTIQFNISNWQESSVSDIRDSRYALYESKQQYLETNRKP